MKKTVRLLSMLMVIAMAMSLVGVNAFAFVPGASGGSGGSGTIIFNADEDMRPSDDSAYVGPVYEDDGDSAQEKVSLPAAPVPTPPTFAASEVKEYSGLMDVDLTGADQYDLVRDNASYIMDLRDRIMAGRVSSAELKSAIMLFGKEAIYGVADNASGYDEALVSEGRDAYAVWEAKYQEIYQSDPAAWDEFVSWNTGVEGIENHLLLVSEGAGEELISAIEGLNSYFMVNEAAIREYLNSENSGNQAHSGSSLMTDGTGDWDFLNINSYGFKSLAQALASAVNPIVLDDSFDICNNSKEYKITVNLRMKTIVSPYGLPAFVINVSDENPDIGSITFTRGTINGEGFAVHEGAILNLGGLYNAPNSPDITVNAECANAVYVAPGGTLVVAEGATLNGPAETTDVSGTIYNEGTVYLTGGAVNGGDLEAIHNNGGQVNVTGTVVNVTANNYAAIWSESGAVNVSGGTIQGLSGIAVEGDTVLNMTGGRVFGVGTAAGNGSYQTIGAAIIGLYEGPTINISGGELYAKRTNAIICTTDGTNTEASRVKEAKLSDENIIKQEYLVGALNSDYARAVVSVNGVGYATLAEAATAAAAYDGEKATVTVTMLASYPDNSGTEYGTDTLDFTENTLGKPIIFNGNGFEMRMDSTDAITVSSGNVTIKNITLRDKGSATAITVADGTVYIGGNVVVKRFDTALAVNDGTVTVNDFMVDDATNTGIDAQGGKTTVTMCKIDCDTPVTAGDPSYLHLNGGWFLHKGDVPTYIDDKVSHLEYVKTDKYHEIMLNNKPKIVANSSGTDANGKPYIIFDKGNMEPLIFEVSPEIESIYAVPFDATRPTIDIAAANRGYSGKIKIEEKVLRELAAGGYDLVFKFLDSSYVVQDSISLYVMPAIAVMYTEYNFLHNNFATRFTSYDISNSGYNIAVIMSELPDGIALGSDASGMVVTQLRNFVNSNDRMNETDNKNVSWQYVQSGKYAGNYVYFISYADLNNLKPGQNYVYLQYGDVDSNLASAAVKSLPFTVTNSNVYITPSTISWSSVKSNATFTVYPAPVSVYIDGFEVDPGYWSYDTVNGTGKFQIKGSYLDTIPAGDHELTVVTNSGKLAAKIHTGPGIAPKDIDYHVYGGTRSLSFVSSADINYDLGITIGSTNAVNVDNFIIRDGSKQFTLSSNYLNRLALGTYTISAYVKTLDANGNEVYQKCNTTFRVISASEASYNPGTGDDFNPVLWLTILGISAVVIVAITVPFVKKSKASREGK